MQESTFGGISTFRTVGVRRSHVMMMFLRLDSDSWCVVDQWAGARWRGVMGWMMRVAVCIGVRFVLPVFDRCFVHVGISVD